VQRPLILPTASRRALGGERLQGHASRQHELQPRGRRAAAWPARTPCEGGREAGGMGGGPAPLKRCSTHLSQSTRGTPEIQVRDYRNGTGTGSAFKPGRLRVLIMEPPPEEGCQCPFTREPSLQPWRANRATTRLLSGLVTGIEAPLLSDDHRIKEETSDVLSSSHH
jgi:hypothetical protein